MPRIRESQDNYQDGYNRGFKQGLEDKQAKKSGSSGSTEIQGNYSAPILGGSSFDPVEFARRKKLESQNSATQIQNPQSENFKEGMERYNLQMEGWEDQKGYEELREKISAIQNIFIKIHLSGMNIISPQTSDELKVYEAMNEAMDNIRSKYYVWQSQKLAYDAATKIIFEQIIKKESDRTIDINATKANMRTLLNTPGILNRTKITENLIVYKSVVEEINVISSITIVKDQDGNVYKTIPIGTQNWMAENLKTTKYCNGDLIRTNTDPESDLSSENTPKYQWAYDGTESNVATFGRLYTWYTVTDNRNICPLGWHVPSDNEWKTLERYLGINQTEIDKYDSSHSWRGTKEGDKLKEIGTTHWKSPNKGATDETGFTAVPGGQRTLSGNFLNIGAGSYWWSATQYDSTKACLRYLFYSTSNIHNANSSKKNGYSIRCIRDY